LNRAADALSRMPSSQDLKLDTTDLPTDLQVEALQMAIDITMALCDNCSRSCRDGVCLF
jgi:hypothetical protein